MITLPQIYKIAELFIIIMFSPPLSVRREQVNT